MKELATLPAVIGNRLLAELEAEGIHADCADLPSGDQSPFAAAMMTIRIEDQADLEKAKSILERILKSMGLDSTIGGLHAEDEIAPDRMIWNAPEGLPPGGVDDPGHFEGDATGGDDG